MSNDQTRTTHNKSQQQMGHASAEKFVEDTDINVNVPGLVEPELRQKPEVSTLIKAVANAVSKVDQAVAKIETQSKVQNKDESSPLVTLGQSKVDSSGNTQLAVEPVKVDLRNKSPMHSPNRQYKVIRFRA